MQKTFRSARRVVPWYKKLNPMWALFGNEDDGFWGDLAFNPAQYKTIPTAIKWWFKNPAHNLMWYVLGVADVDRYVSGKHGDRIWNPTGRGWQYCWTHLTIIKLPFVSYISNSRRFYLGWRPGGAFSLPRLSKHDT